MYKLWLQMYNSVNSQRPLFLMNWSMQDEYLAFKKVEERLRLKSNGLPANDCKRSDDNKKVTDILTAERITKISCIGILSKVVFVFYGDGSKISISVTLNKLMKILPKDDFFMINQSCIMRRSLILGTEPLPSRRVRLALKQPFDKLDYKIIKVVSQRASSDFLIWYNKHKG